VSTPERILHPKIEDGDPLKTAGFEALYLTRDIVQVLAEQTQVPLDQRALTELVATISAFDPTSIKSVRAGPRTQFHEGKWKNPIPDGSKEGHDGVYIKFKKPDYSKSEFNLYGGEDKIYLAYIHYPPSPDQSIRAVADYKLILAHDWSNRSLDKISVGKLEVKGLSHEINTVLTENHPQYSELITRLRKITNQLLELTSKEKSVQKEIKPDQFYANLYINPEITRNNGSLYEEYKALQRFLDQNPELVAQMIRSLKNIYEARVQAGIDAPEDLVTEIFTSLGVLVLNYQVEEGSGSRRSSPIAETENGSIKNRLDVFSHFANRATVLLTKNKGAYYPSVDIWNYIFGPQIEFSPYMWRAIKKRLLENKQINFLGGKHFPRLGIGKEERIISHHRPPVYKESKYDIPAQEIIEWLHEKEGKNVSTGEVRKFIFNKGPVNESEWTGIVNRVKKNPDIHLESVGHAAYMRYGEETELFRLPSKYDQAADNIFQFLQEQPGIYFPPRELWEKAYKQAPFEPNQWRRISSLLKKYYGVTLHRGKIGTYGIE